MDPQDKSQWRRHIRTARSARSTRERARVDAHLSEIVAAVTRPPGGAVAAYVPVGTEPGSTSLLDAARAAGRRVLVPLIRGDGPLWWADYEGRDSLTAAAYGLLEPTGPALEPHTLALAELVLIPALAVDRAGVRLGRGAGFYDRSLHVATATAILAAVVFDDEVVPALPADPHDVPVTHALTPSAGLVRLGGR